MKALVTGAAGFIGGQLVRRLRQDGHDVIGWDDFSNASNDPGGVVRANLRTNIYPSPMPAADVVYHLACTNQANSFKNPYNDLLVNGAGTLNLIRLMGKTHKWPHLVYTSSASVYGHGPFVEGGRTVPVTPYGVSKLAAEGYVRLLAPSFTILRLSNVYGPGQNVSNPNCGVVSKFIDLARRGKALPVVPGKTRDFTYVDDVLDALVLAARDRWIGVHNVSTATETSIEALAARVRSAVAAAASVQRLAGSKIEDMAQRDSDSVNSRRVPYAKVYGMYGWRPQVTLEEGIRMAVEATK